MARVLTSKGGIPVGLDDDMPVASADVEDVEAVDDVDPVMVPNTVEDAIVRIVVDGVEFDPKGDFRAMVYNGATSGSTQLVECLGRPCGIVKPATPSDKATAVVRDYIREHSDGDTPAPEIYVVWQCHILGHKKWLISTDMRDGMYYEVTYDSGKEEYYLDAYKKFHNVAYQKDRVESLV